jgi:orotate phosphoribosyltransferase
LISAEILRKKGVVVKNHFMLTTGRHTMEYVFKEKILLEPTLFSEIILNFVKLSRKFSFDMITGPAQLGAIFASPVAFLLIKPFVFPEKTQSGKKEMYFRKSFADAIHGKKLLIIDDNITTGSSINQVLIAISQLGGDVAGILALWNRENYQPKKWKNGSWSEEKIPLFSLIGEKIPSYDSRDNNNHCPGCMEKLRLIDPKKG